MSSKSIHLHIYFVRHDDKLEGAHTLFQDFFLGGGGYGKDTVTYETKGNALTKELDSQLVIDKSKTYSFKGFHTKPNARFSWNRFSTKI